MSKRYNSIIFVTIGLIVLAGLGYYLYKPAAPTPAAEAAAPAPAAESNDGNIVDYDEATAPQWVKDALEPRSLGSESAPVVIFDHSSMTCPHCATFHKETLPKLKAEYIDTGKVRLVFDDFPLNLPALQASALARCVKGDDTYFAYIDQLFETQAQWATSGDVRANLLGTIKFTGLSRAEAEKCLDDKTLAGGLLEAMDAAQKKHGIESTPSFVINDKEVISGARSYEDFKAAIDAALK